MVKIRKKFSLALGKESEKKKRGRGEKQTKTQGNERKLKLLASVTVADIKHSPTASQTNLL